MLVQRAPAIVRLGGNGVGFERVSRPPGRGAGLASLGAGEPSPSASAIAPATPPTATSARRTRSLCWIFMETDADVAAPRFNGRKGAVNQA